VIGRAAPPTIEPFSASRPAACRAAADDDAHDADDALTTAASSVPHAPQLAQRPSHFGVVAPHAEQTNADSVVRRPMELLEPRDGVSIDRLHAR
jgi:hypothetical protein